MSDAAVHFPDASAQEQGGIGVETGFDRKKALVFIQEKLSAWKEVDRLDVQLLRALCQLTLANQARAARGFSSWELADEISKIRNHPWSDETSKEQMSKAVRLQWKNLLKTWGQKSEGIQQQFSDAQFTHIPVLQKIEGGGAGKPTLYRIGWESAKPVVSSARPDEEEILPAFNRRIVRYVCEDIEEANFFARIFTGGFQIKGWRRQLYVLALCIPVFFLWLLSVPIVLSLTGRSAIGGNNIITLLLLFGVIFWAVLVTLGPLYRLGTNRIVMAPWWMQSVDDDRLLERRSPPRYPDKSIKAVRYVAECRLCGGKVSATKGRIEFFGRIVGRCEEAPVEHVYSFDHITRSGKLLR